MYDRDTVQWMWQQLEGVGLEPLDSAEKVDKFMADMKGTALLVINSVCGCAAGSARPGVALALQNEVIPDRLATVFAGVDREATEQARKYLGDVPPSSPSVVLFKDGHPEFVLHRSDIEGESDVDVSKPLKKAFSRNCTHPGPSVAWEKVVEHFQ
ncbi:MAG: BrxA/BrxB family bacilliredoxin [Candidatus Zixiibacteriota bacterium]